MSKEMIVSVNGREKKIAILDNGKVTEFYIERGEENSGVVGNVYKGKVMRVLPGMQSAFVDIGLERDAFLYVSDFFDEDEEIERIVMEKGKKVSPEEAKREANEHIERSRIDREKQMDAAQEITEPMSVRTEETEEPSEEAAAPAPEKGKRDRGERGGRGRGRKSRDEETSSRESAPPIEINFDNSGFERIADEDGDPSPSVEPVKVDRARAVEFNMETAAELPVGSLLGEVASDAGGFERIADEDEAPAEPVKKGRKSAAPKKEPKAKAERPAKEKAPAKKRASRSKKSEDGSSEPLADGEASVSEPSDTAEMAVRRGGRGRRRGGKGKPKGEGEGSENGENGESDAMHTSDIDVSAAPDSPDDSTPANEIQASDYDDAGSDPADAPEADATGNDNNGNVEAKTEDRPEREPRGRGRGGRGRGRNERDDRPTERTERSERPEKTESSERPERTQRNDRPERNDRSRGGRGGRDRDRDRGPAPLISDLLKEGQEILVQIAKEPIAKKGARITSHIALPGRYLVYMPTIEHLGVSRKIESSSERSRLRTLIQRIRQDPEITSGGFIVRTAGIGISEEDLRNDAKYLHRSWQGAKKGSEKKKSPAIIHQDLDLVQRLLRDQLSDDFTAIRVDSEEEYLRTVEFMERMAPRMVNRVKLYTRDEPILDYYGVQEEVDKALKPRVWLKSGGYLVINQTEALVAIDVNTGKFVGKGNARLEDTITRTNMEAVDEIARQIRLRDLGGIIVLDLIDMDDRRNRNKVSQALQEALASDRSPNKVLSFNDFGLIIMTRKRVKQSLERTMCTPCDNCEGAGWVKSPTTTAYEILAEARRLSKHLDDVRHTTLRIHPEVAKALRNEERAVMDEIEAYLGTVDINSDKSVHQGQFDFAFV